MHDRVAAVSGDRAAADRGPAVAAAAGLALEQDRRSGAPGGDGAGEGVVFEPVWSTEPLGSDTPPGPVTLSETSAWTRSKIERLRTPAEATYQKRLVSHDAVRARELVGAGRIGVGDLDRGEAAAVERGAVEEHHEPARVMAAEQTPEDDDRIAGRDRVRLCVNRDRVVAEHVPWRRMPRRRTGADGCQRNRGAGDRSRRADDVLQSHRCTSWGRAWTSRLRNRCERASMRSVRHS